MSSMNTPNATKPLIGTQSMGPDYNWFKENSEMQHGGQLLSINCFALSNYSYWAIPAGADVALTSKPNPATLT